MANDLLLQTESDSESAVALMDGVELDLTFGVPVEDKSVFVDLYESLRDIFFPPKLPPLVLTSTRFRCRIGWRSSATLGCQHLRHAERRVSRVFAPRWSEGDY